MDKIQKVTDLLDQVDVSGEGQGIIFMCVSREQEEVSIVGFMKGSTLTLSYLLGNMAAKDERFKNALKLAAITCDNITKSVFSEEDLKQFKKTKNGKNKKLRTY